MKIPHVYITRERIKGFSNIARLAFLILALLVLLSGHASAEYSPYSYSPPGECDETPCLLPYFVVQGGDLAGGSSFYDDAGGGTYCTMSNGFALAGWNNANNHDYGWFGAAVQGSVIDSDVAEDIVDDLNSDNPPSNDHPTNNGTFTETQDDNYDYPSADYPLGLNHTNYPPASTLDQSPYYLGIANNDQDYANYAFPVTNTSGLGTYNPVPGYFGGDFQNSLPCIPNTYQNTGGDSGTPLSSLSAQAYNPSTDTVNLSQLGSGTYSFGGYDINNPYAPAQTLYINDSPDGAAVPGSGDVTPIPANTNITLNVYGNVYIQSNVTYGQYKISTVPSVNVNVTGFRNAYTYVQYNVTQLHGFYTTSTPTPSSGSVGTFYSCADINPGSGQPEEDLTYGDCSPNQLTLYGTVEADKIFLARDWGDLNTDNPTAMTKTDPVTGKDTNASNAAEVFRYSPELWVPDANIYTPPAPTPPPPGQPGAWQSVTSLPPVL